MHLQPFLQIVCVTCIERPVFALQDIDVEHLLSHFILDSLKIAAINESGIPSSRKPVGYKEDMIIEHMACSDSFVDSLYDLLKKTNIMMYK